MFVALAREDGECIVPFVNTRGLHRGSFVPCVLILMTTTQSSARAEVIAGVEFPAGIASFADRVASHVVAPSGVLPPQDNPALALGAPDDTGADEQDTYFSLGNASASRMAGELVLEFVDNRLINIEGDDLYIFEIGPEVESTQIAVSTDGTTWYELGIIQGSTRGVDLANFADVPAEHFRFVRLRDAPGASTTGSPWAGPDIDAVGTIGADVSDEDGDEVLDVDDECPEIVGTPPVGCPVEDDAGVDAEMPVDGMADAAVTAQDAGLEDAAIPSTDAGAAGSGASPTTDSGIADDRCSSGDEGSDDSGGCSCRIGMNRSDLPSATLPWLMALWPLMRSRRRRDPT